MGEGKKERMNEHKFLKEGTTGLFDKDFVLSSWFVGLTFCVWI